MKILDWRSRAEKMVTSFWRGSAAGPSARPSVGPVGRTWAAVHNRIVAQRVAARPQTPGRPLIVSVGNLALGGTGKTPVVIQLAQDLAARGRSGVVLVRGYRSPLAGPLEVDTGNQRAGDEARLLAQALAPQQWPVVQARVRAQGLRHVLQRQPLPEVVLLEDGHQTAGIGRDLDVVILDHWGLEETPDGLQVAPLTGPVVPLGPWRESQKGAQRAQVWLLECSEEMPASGTGGSRVFTFQRSFACRAANESAAALEQPERPVLVSGIARPEKFEENVQQMFGAAAPLAVRLADHAPYTRPLVERVRRAATTAGCACIVTTAKDWVKLEPFWPHETPAYIIDLAIVWGDGETLSDLVEERL